ncbi:MAG: dienelactone hydrolase family protein [Pseudomonadota bacterium]|nr:dienelactone hydrolase family protein [Pseudomonadota bacterium]
MGTHIPFIRTDGKKAHGYLAKAAKANAPGVVVIQEWWGLSGNITAICDRFALAGYDALVPDFFGGTLVPYHDHHAAEQQVQKLDFADAAQNSVRGAAQLLKRSSSKVAVVGFCMGGAVAMLAANAPEISAVAPFYGLPPEQYLDISKLKIPVQGHFSNTDDFVTPERANTFEAALNKAGVKNEIFRYDASHAFMNEQRDVYDRAASELAWGRLLGFLKANLN